MSNTIEQMQKDLYEGNADAVKAGVEKALAEGMSAQDILERGLIGGMDVVGRDFKCGDLYIPEVLLCARGAGAHEAGGALERAAAGCRRILGGEC